MSANAKSSRYFVNLPIDALLIGGVSILMYLAMRMWSDGTRTEATWTIAGYLVWVVNWPHFSATNYRLYGSRAHIRQYPVTATVIPFLVLAAIVGSFASPLVIAPYWIKLFLIWSPYHFSGQTIGISLLYARRAGYSVGSFQRTMLSGFVYGTFLLGMVRAEVGLASGQYFGVAYPTFGLPMSVVTAVEAMVIVCGATFTLIVIAKAWKQKQLPPFLFLLPGVTQYVWFVPGGLRPGYMEFVPLFHSLQYLLIAWSMQLKEKADRSGSLAGGSTVKTGRGYVVKESMRWYVLNVIGGAVLFAFLPFLATKVGVSVPLATAVIISGVQIHHFFVDGVIWKLRSPTVASPLKVNVLEMMREPAPDASSSSPASDDEKQPKEAA